MQRFLTAYLTNGNIRSSLEVSGLTEREHYYWVKRDADYKAAFEEAKAERAGQEMVKKTPRVFTIVNGKLSGKTAAGRKLLQELAARKVEKC